MCVLTIKGSLKVTIRRENEADETNERSPNETLVVRFVGFSATKIH